jgi:hypothetical protein
MWLSVHRLRGSLSVQCVTSAGVNWTGNAVVPYSFRDVISCGLVPVCDVCAPSNVLHSACNFRHQFGRYEWISYGHVSQPAWLRMATPVRIPVKNSMEQRPSWEANCRSASQEIPQILLNPKFHYRVYRSPPLDSVLSQMGQSTPTCPVCLRFILVLSCHLRLGLPSGLFTETLTHMVTHTP